VPAVTVVVASRDRRAELLASVPRHLALPERPPVIVVDDASTDGTADALAAAHPQVELIRLAASAGGAARNAGVRAAATPYVAFSDDDAWWRPGALARSVALLDAHPRVAVVQARILVGPDEREDPTCLEMAASPLPRAGGQPGHPILSFVACAAVVRRGAFLAAGGFSERLAVGGEEELLGWDLAAAGWQLSYVPEIVAHHHPPPAADGRPARRETTLRNALWTAWLRRPGRAAARATAAAVARAPGDRATARALVRAVAEGAWVLRERRVSPPHVEAMRRRLEVRRDA
jgi:N-acetylglucosaminyl-diphospho-decaprenol L-rhamnosyltransferase